MDIEKAALINESGLIGWMVCVNPFLRLYRHLTF